MLLSPPPPADPLTLSPPPVNTSSLSPPPAASPPLRSPPAPSYSVSPSSPTSQTAPPPRSISPPPKSVQLQPSNLSPPPSGSTLPPPSAASPSPDGSALPPPSDVIVQPPPASQRAPPPPSTSPPPARPTPSAYGQSAAPPDQPTDEPPSSPDSSPSYPPAAPRPLTPDPVSPILPPQDLLSSAPPPHYPPPIRAPQTGSRPPRPPWELASAPAAPSYPLQAFPSTPRQPPSNPQPLLPPSPPSTTQQATSPPPAPVWERLLDSLLESPLQRVGRPLTVLLRSRASLSVSTTQNWTAAISGPGSNQMTLRPLGRMDGPVEVPSATPAEYQWSVTVPGQQMQTAGKYRLFVYYNGSLSVPPVVTGNGSTVTVYPGPPEPSMCNIKVTPLANTTAVGDPVAIDLTLRDSYGNPASETSNVSVWLVGPASKRTILPGSNFSSLQGAAAGGSGSGSGSGSSGLFRYVHVLEAQELLTVWLNVSGTTVGNATLNVSITVPNVDTAATTTAETSKFDPAVNPMVSFNLTLPATSVTLYPGGAETMLADYRTLLASSAGLPSTDNVLASLSTASSTSGSVLLAFKVYFDSDWASTTSSFASMTSLEWFYFRLSNLPASVLQDKATYPDLDASVVKVTALSLSEPFASTLASKQSTATSSESAVSSPASITILSYDFDSDPVAAAPSSSSVLTLPAAAVPSPPMLTMLGQPYVEVLETEAFTDLGVTAYDVIDGFNVEARVTVRTCVRAPDPAALVAAANVAAVSTSHATGSRTTVSAAAAAAARATPPSAFTCSGASPTSSGGDKSAATSNQSLAIFASGAVTLKGNSISAATQMYLLSYSAVNSRGVAAAPRYRVLVIKSRCNGGEFWCPSLSACSISRVCSSGLARMSTALQMSRSASTSSAAAASAAASSALPEVDPSTLSVVSSPDGAMVVVSTDGRTMAIDPLSHTESSLSSSDSYSYGILGDIMAMGFDGLTMRFDGLTAAASSQQPVYVKDPLPPVITLLGSGQPALTPSGIAVMIDRVEVGSDWADPGASVWDAFDGDLTALLQTYGAAAVDTSRPTMQGLSYSYIVEYQASDLTGNLAQPALRLIRLVCPGSESICTDADGLPACTRDGICGSPESTATGSASTSTARSVEQPRLTLVGASLITIQQGTPFDRCTAVVPQDQPCDPGAVAADSRDGNLDLRVMVCGVPLRASRAGQTLLPLLLACNASTATPGIYTIVYSVANSAGRSTSVSRTLRVQAVCPDGEVLCADGMTCSEGGVCKADTNNPSTPNTVVSATAASSASTGRTQLALITAAAAPAFIKLPRGSTYAPCPTDADLTASSTPFCEPGATAVDSTGAVNLTDRVVVCPPSDCLYRTASAGSSSGGCSSDLLRRHTLAAKGLAGCGLNTLAPVGAIFNIDFWVWDYARPPSNATVRRTIVITDPCTDEAAPHFCSNGAGGFLCSPSPCDATATFLPPAATGPSITLLPSADVIYVEYGTASQVYLGPCASVYDTDSCGAVAVGSLLPTSPFGSITESDLTAQLSVINTTPCNMTANGNTSSLPTLW
ncbi:hypothetical protein PLESTM_000514400 [Pleodorina starrii]|nr:hypothetical protein PLESTM_000514400 [Pleodorina starrii]